MAGRDELDLVGRSAARRRRRKRTVATPIARLRSARWVEARSYAAIANEFGVRPRTVERWARDGAWKQRLRAIEAAAARKADDELGQPPRETARRVPAADRGLEHRLRPPARSGEVRITASDFVGLIKVALLLQGAPAARVEVIAASSEWAGLRSRILQALSEHPQARLALAEALEQTEDDDDTPR